MTIAERSIISILGFIILTPFILIFRAIGRANDQKHYKNPEDFKILLDNLRKMSPVEISHWIHENIKYKPDPLKSFFDYQQTPLITLMKGTADCEDYASLWREIIATDKESRIFSAFKFGRQGHVMLAVHYQDNRYFICSNNMFYNIVADDFQGAYDWAAKEFFSGDYTFTIRYIQGIDLPFFINKKPKQ